MENIDKNMENLLRDVSILAKLDSEHESNYNKILSRINRKNRIRIFGRAILASTAVVLLAFVFKFSFADTTVEQIDITTVEIPMLITDSGEKISLDTDKSYRLELTNNAVNSSKSTSSSKNFNNSTSSSSYKRVNAENYTNNPATSVSRNTVIIPSGYTYDIKFDDGSEAHLNSGSYIEFPKSFETKNERVVSLTGEGYFKVAKSDKPFIVKANGLLIKVYGTEFNINTNKHDRVEAILITGSIGVKYETDSAEIILKPNDMLVYDIEKKSSTVNVVNPQDYLAWMNGDFSCSGQPLYYLIDEISAFYGIAIEKDSLLENQLITICLSRQLGYIQIMEILETAFGLQFSKTGNQTYICKQINNTL